MEDKKLMVTDSRYFSREFNTAIIDGPLRIYFADRQESDALKIYFYIQEILADRGVRLDSFPLDKPNMFLMLYPTQQTFKSAFDQESELASEAFGEHFVLGVNGPYTLETQEQIGLQVRGVLVDGIKFFGKTIRES
jgi:hypothetical protein